MAPVLHIYIIFCVLMLSHTGVFVVFIFVLSHLCAL